MLTYPTRATLEILRDDPMVRYAVKLGLVFMSLPIGLVLFDWMVPRVPIIDWLFQVYVVTVGLSAVVWLTFRTRLWLTLLIGTTVWSLGMLALTLWSLLACVGR